MGDVIDQAERRARAAWDMFLEGHSYSEIAERLHLPAAGTACGEITRMAHEAGLHRKTLGGGLLEVELARLDKLQATLAPHAANGDPQSVALVLKIQERRAKYLGLDAPERREITGQVTLAQLVEASMVEEPQQIDLKATSLLPCASEEALQEVRNGEKEETSKKA
jgi:hypothetical protein